MLNGVLPKGSFDVTVDLVGVSSAVAYSAGDIISGNGATNLTEVSFLPEIGGDTDRLWINFLEVISENALITPEIYLFNSQITVSDNAAFAPNYTQIKTLEKYISSDDFTVTKTSGTTFNITQAKDLSRYINLPSNGKLYMALVTTGAYTPKNSENYRIRLQGLIL
jgi:hypothetical protein